MLLSLFDTLLQPAKKTLDEPIRQEEFEIAVDGRNVPVRILFEARFNNRVSVNHNGVLIRISNKQNKEEQKKNIDTFLKWAKTKLGEKPQLLDHLPQRKYSNGEILKVGNHDFRINIFYHDLQKSTARIHNNQIVISIAKGLTKEAEDNANSYLVAKCLSKFFQPIVAQRIHELNQKYFGKNIQSVRMKYNTSNWGSCSTQGNINISTRLMFAPDDVIDYVLIHELAHLIHADHSARFWKVVEKIMPDYAHKEKHLSKNNHQYYL
jgi:hypothetical protein